MKHARHVMGGHGAAASIATSRRGGGRPRRRRGLRRALALLLAALLIVQGSLGTRGGTASAAETEDGDLLYLSVGNPIWYGGLGTMNTARMSVNGEVAYCSDPVNEPPRSGYYQRQGIQTIEHNGWRWPVESVDRILFYGYGGPGFDAGFWRDHIGGTDADGRSFEAGKDWDGSSITNDEFYAYTHILVSDRVTSDGSVALRNTSERFKAWFCWNILGYTYGSMGGVENEDAVGIAIDDLDVPSGFESFQFDTGHNSMWNTGNKSQTVVSFEYNPYVEVRFDKVSADAALTSGNEEYAYAGATYDIYEADTGTLVATVTTDETGSASCELEPDTSYYAVETAAPRGFVVSEERVEFSTGTEDATVELPDRPGTIELTVQKRDAATQGAAQAGATLEGAEYTVVDANGNAHTATTDANGHASFSGLPLGAASVTETRAPEGYRLDPTVHEYHVSADDLPEGGVVELAPEGDFDESVMAFDLDLVKYRDTGAEGSGLQDPAAGVEFQVISGTTGQVVATLTTDEKGFATTSGGWFGAGERPEGVLGALPYDRGGYVVREVASTTPEGYQPAPEWSIAPEQMVDGATLHYIVDNDFVATRIQVVKTDAASGQTVPLAGFTFQLLDAEGNALSQDVWYPNHEQVSEFTTDETGCVTFPGRLAPGTYRIREVSAAAPYLVSDQDVTVTIENSPEVPPISVVTFPDEQATGSATISKRCSTGPQESAGGVCDAGCADSLAGAEFDVVAMQDVIAPDGTVQAAEGQTVTHVTTGEDGTATADGLPLGTGTATYAFLETVAPSGHALDATPHEFTLAYADDRTAVVTASVEAVDEPTVVTLDKTVLGTDEPLPGATFALWSDAEGDEDPAEDERTLVTTDESGTIALRHLPAGTYHLAEVEAPDGYLASGEPLTFTVDETGTIEGASSLELSVEDDFTKVSLSKRDITNEEEVPGAHLSVLDAEGNVVESWVSGEEPHLIEALPVGTYTLVEEMTPHTYDEATAVEFQVASTGEVQTVTMYDEPIEVSGSVDKRQEVADVESGTYDYSVDARSTSPTWVDEFTVTDDLTAAADGLAELTGITTPVADGDYDGLLNVWYRTDRTAPDLVDESGANATLSDGHANPWLQSEETAERLGDDGRVLSYDGWRLWAQDVSATEATELSVSDLDLAEGEKVVAVRLEYGRVDPDFTTRTGEWDRDGLKDVCDDVSDVAAHEGDLTEAGTERSPLVVHMRLTDAYRPGTTLVNQARLDLYRNGGGSEELEGHDEDRVEQAREATGLARTGDVALPVTGVAAFGVVAVLLSMRRRRR
ncbi:hypothetical protein H6A07_04295 [Olsenella uli]|uniref:SpaA isopeptide-forming pilin-related protein n=1 Tax=Olsenella uli TaxID=133926 RepID=UPI00195610FA|nr:SpaA isopeptide-forming pilin-related protein [Olsenella uli]MBM6675965.1 hypothetical protein [Olsenella uli]